MGKTLGNLGGRMLIDQDSIENVQGEFRGKFWRNFQSLRFKFRGHKRHIRKKHVKFLKIPWTSRCPWATGRVSRQIFCQSSCSTVQETAGTPAGRLPFVPTGVPGVPRFFLTLCAFSCPENFWLFFSRKFCSAEGRQ